jgi:hypothetical protein
MKARHKKTPVAGQLLFQIRVLFTVSENVSGALHVAESAENAAARRATKISVRTVSVVDGSNITAENLDEGLSTLRAAHIVVGNKRVCRRTTVAGSVTESALLNRAATLKFAFSPAMVRNTLEEVDEVGNRVTFMSH